MKLAREAYEGALETARAGPSAAAWTRLLRCARNLRAAIEQRNAAAEAARSAPLTWQAEARPAEDWRAGPATRPKVAGLRQEIERARELMRRSRALVQESRALRASVAAELGDLAAQLLAARQGTHEASRRDARTRP